jgi:hypothetical protein
MSACRAWLPRYKGEGELLVAEAEAAFAQIPGDRLG